MIRYPVSIANYPEFFKGCVVSPTKICLQFTVTECKLRLHGADRAAFAKYGPDSDRMIPVGTLGTQVDSIAVGCQMPVVVDYQLQLIDAYAKYYQLYRDKYKETYGEEFAVFIAKVYARLGGLLNEINKNEQPKDE